MAAARDRRGGAGASEGPCPAEDEQWPDIDGLPFEQSEQVRCDGLTPAC
jgi:hypothetical protein